MESAKFSQTLSPEADALLGAIRAQGFPGWSFMTIAQTRGMMATLKPLAGQNGFFRQDPGRSAFAGARHHGAGLSRHAAVLHTRSSSVFTKAGSSAVTPKRMTGACAGSRLLLILRSFP